LTAALAVAVSLVASPASADATTVTVSDATVGTGSIAVAGSITWGTDATEAVVLGTDPSGDATASAPGMDLTGISVRPDIAGKKLIWTLSTANGLPDPVGGPLPAAMGYMVPISVDDEDWWRWLGAATAASGNAQAAKWTGLCHNEVEGAQGAWSCPGSVFTSAGAFPLAGSITSTGVTWTQGFTQMKPTMQYGSVVASSGIHCGGPCSLAFPVGLVGALTPIDTMFMESYKIPGQVKLAVALTGVTPNDGAFGTVATFNGVTGAFSGTLAKPAAAGAYTVWARTCFGKAEAPTCSVGTTDITV
jgi:hypothetical protein